ncbi:MAG: tetratricopeptide (TPR) repeat protein [Cyclobacteriaceae bacterium]|jgi:tetratricopeptide (TPR) repeat protein
MPIKLNVISLSIIFLFLKNAGFSQTLPIRPNQIDVNSNKNGGWVYYYDSEWNTLENGTKAAFYRLITYKDGKPIGQVADYFLNGQLQMSIDSVINEDPLQYEGMLAEYSDEANIVLVEYMQNGQMDTTSTILKFRQLIDIYQQEIPDHLDLAYTANNLAYLYREQQQYDSAEVYYRLAKEIREKQLGTNNVIYANSCNKLGYVLMKQGKLEQAEPMYMISKQIHGQTLGKESDYYKNANGNLAYIYMETGRYELAEPLYQEAVAIQLKSKGKEDESYRYNCYQLARVYARLNQREKALDFYLKAKNLSEISKEHLRWFEDLIKE